MKTIVISFPTPKRKLTRRQMAEIIVQLRAAHVFLTHADRDRCILHLMQGRIMTEVLRDTLPKRIARNEEWMRARVTAPGDRLFLRSRFIESPES